MEDSAIRRIIPGVTTSSRTRMSRTVLRVEIELDSTELIYEAINAGEVRRSFHGSCKALIRPYQIVDNFRYIRLLPLCYLRYK
jgi:hypothetical protein